MAIVGSLSERFHIGILGIQGTVFNFEKTFSVANCVAADYQSNIWYIEFVDMWLSTTDKSNVINAWDLNQESLLYSIKSHKIGSTIIDIVPIEVLKTDCRFFNG